MMDSVMCKGGSYSLDMSLLKDYMEKGKNVVIGKLVKVMDLEQNNKYRHNFIQRTNSCSWPISKVHLFSQHYL